MNYKGKYSLKTQLLTEAIEAPQPDGSIKYRSGKTGQRLWDTEAEAIEAARSSSASALTGKISQGALKDVLEGAGHIVHSVASSNEGADIVCTANGVKVNLELGVQGKTAQLGFYYPENVADSRHGWSDYTRKKESIVERQDAMIEAFGARFKPGLQLAGAGYLAYWNASGDDVIIFGTTRTGPFLGLAITEKGKLAFPHLDVATTANFGTGTITGSGQTRSPSAGGQKRYGFRAFGKESGALYETMKSLIQ